MPRLTLTATLTLMPVKFMVSWAYTTDLIELYTEPTYCYIGLSGEHGHDKVIRIMGW